MKDQIEFVLYALNQVTRDTLDESITQMSDLQKTVHHVSDNTELPSYATVSHPVIFFVEEGLENDFVSTISEKANNIFPAVIFLTENKNIEVLDDESIVADTISLEDMNVDLLTRSLRYLTQLQRFKIEANIVKTGQSQSLFLANLSHEIRTPMNGLMGMLDLAMDPIISDKYRMDYLKTARSAADLLMTLLNDVLDISKIEARKMHIDSSPFAFVEELQDTLHISSCRAIEKGLEFRVKVSQEIPKMVNGDSIRLKQVLNNLLDNAIKFTENGFIHLSISMVEESGDHVQLKFNVEDTGIGISEENLPKIFNSFSQADYSIHNRYGGTGLGLSISSKLVELMGGQLEVFSQLDQGSVFSFTLPFERVTEKEEPALEDGSTNDYAELRLSGVNILLAEDDQISQKAITKVLQKAGARVTLAEDGQQALDIFYSPTVPIGLIVMDCMMPNVDGLTATRKIRQIEAHKNMMPTPIVALTANVLKENADKCLEAGMNAFLCKPVDRHQLIYTIDSLVNTAPTPVS